MKYLHSLLMFSALLVSPALAQDAPANPLDALSHAWEDDRIWFDGKAECAVYDGTRTIYGKARQYTARLYTNKEVADAEPTYTKSSDNRGLAVFKHHLREDIATENYDYHYSTMAYVTTGTWTSYKLEVGSIEDCGSTFKQYLNHGGQVKWLQSSYFPGEGLKQGTFDRRDGFVFQDALSLVLRGYPFDAPPASLTLPVLPDQTSNKLSPTEPQPMAVELIGTETLDLPLGPVEAHHLRVFPAEGGENQPEYHYWFAADTALQHILVQFDDGHGQTLKLREVERRAYWERD